MRVAVVLVVVAALLGASVHAASDAAEEALDVADAEAVEVEVEADVVDAEADADAAEDSDELELDVADDAELELEDEVEADADADAEDASEADIPPALMKAMSTKKDDAKTAKATPAAPTAPAATAKKEEPKKAATPTAPAKKETAAPAKRAAATPAPTTKAATKTTKTTPKATVKADVKPTIVVNNKKVKVKPKAKGGRRSRAVRKLATIKGISIEEKEYQRHFANFMRKHHRIYKAADMTKRYNQYKQNWKFVDNFNKLNGEHDDKTFKLSTNQFADHSHGEFARKLGFKSARKFAPAAHEKNVKAIEGLTKSAPSGDKAEAYKAAARNDAEVGKAPGAAAGAAAGATAGAASSAAPKAAASAKFKSIPSSKNWADDKNVVAPIRMQGTCGSCWSFATTCVVESANAILTGKLTPGAPQHMLDCCSGQTWAPCDGCNGGDYMTAYRFVTANGLCAWQDYPYTGVAPAQCKPCKAVNWISGGQVVASNGDEVSLMAAVNRGPVATAVMANLPTFQFYSTGVYNDLACPKDFGSLDHAVVLTGYGTTEDGLDYWWLRNTWDTTWGESGYMRLARGINACGVALEATQPTAVLNPASPEATTMRRERAHTPRVNDAVTNPNPNPNANANGGGVSENNANGYANGNANANVPATDYYQPQPQPEVVQPQPEQPVVDYGSDAGWGQDGF